MPSHCLLQVLLQHPATIHLKIDNIIHPSPPPSRPIRDWNSSRAGWNSYAFLQPQLQALPQVWKRKQTYVMLVWEMIPLYWIWMKTVFIAMKRFLQGIQDLINLEDMSFYSFKEVVVKVWIILGLILLYWCSIDAAIFSWVWKFYLNVWLFLLFYRYIMDYLNFWPFSEIEIKTSPKLLNLS